MASSSLLQWPSPTPHTALLLATSTAIATVGVLFVARAALWPRPQKILRNPLTTVFPRASPRDLEGLVYRPDQFPGARDVDTPYGYIRVYEFGPEDGQKVLLVHGISTSCITLGRIAEGLVERGCRVMLFDLFGRGFTDGVGDLPHDSRLFVTQILLVLASSPLSWTGDSAFRLIGYSLGGGIAIHLANTFPRMVSSLVLLAPAGLIRAESFGAITNFVFSSGVIPERLLAAITRRRLQRPIASGGPKKKNPRRTVAAQSDSRLGVAAAEVSPRDAAGDRKETTPLEDRVLQYVRWMVLNHDGFVPAFMSTIRFGPLTAQHESWRGLAARPSGSTAVYLAEDDEIIDADDYTRHGLPLAGGEGNVRWRILPGTHDFVMTHSGRIVDELEELWEMKKE